jgi:hypothetical protein
VEASPRRVRKVRIHPVGLIGPPEATVGAPGNRDAEGDGGDSV